MAGERYRGLDGLRGVCALTVVLFHCRGLFSSKFEVFQHGFLAVDVFFLLSGFVIALTYEIKLKSSAISAPGFLLRRARRLLPTYWLGAAIALLVFVALAASGIAFPGYTQTMIWVIVPITTLLLVPEFVTPDSATYPAMGGVAWSLFAEWIVNILYALGLFRLGTRTLLALAAVLWLAATAFAFHAPLGWFFGAARNEVLGPSMLRCAPPFLLGVAIFRLHKQEIFKRLPVIPVDILLAIWIGIAALPGFGRTPVLDTFIVIVASPLLVCLTIRSEATAPAYSGILGELSYPLYVVHPGIVLLAASTPLFGLGRGANALAALGVVVVSIAAAWLVKEVNADLTRALTSVRQSQEGRALSSGS